MTTTLWPAKVMFLNTMLELPTMFYQPQCSPVLTSNDHRRFRNLAAHGELS